MLRALMSLAVSPSLAGIRALKKDRDLHEPWLGKDLPATDLAKINDACRQFEEAYTEKAQPLTADHRRKFRDDLFARLERKE
jgi:hypothetical protein